MNEVGPIKEIKLLSATLASPIERVRGGNIVVSVSCRFWVTHEGGVQDELTVSGVASCGTGKDDVGSIRSAMREAIQDAKANLDLVGVVLGAVGGRSEGDAAIIHAFASAEAETVVKAKAAAGETERVSKLEGPVTDVLQKEVDQLLETLGVTSIPLMGQDGSAGWTLGEAIALRGALNDKVKVFLPDERTKGVYKGN